MRFTHNVFLNGTFYPCGAEIIQHREDFVKSVEEENKEEAVKIEETKESEPKKLTKMEIIALKADEAKAIAPDYGIDPELSGAAIKRALNERFGY